MADHRRSIRHELRVMKRGLYQFALLLPNGTVAREQPLSGKSTKGLLDQPRFVEFFRLLDEDLPGEVGMTELIDMPRADLVVSDVAEFTRDAHAKCQRIEGEPLREHLTDDGQHNVDVRSWRPRQSCHCSPASTR